jgi:hypothetical protein
LKKAQILKIGQIFPANKLVELCIIPYQISLTHLFSKFQSLLQQMFLNDFNFLYIFEKQIGRSHILTQYSVQHSVY